MFRTIATIATVAIVAIVLLTGCASVTGSTNQSMSVQTRAHAGTEVRGANCELTNNKGKWFITTPGSVMVHRSNDDMQVLCQKPGLEPGRAAVVSEIKGTMFGNIIIGGGIGAIIDHSNGSAYEYPNFVQVVMGLPSTSEPAAAAAAAVTPPIAAAAAQPIPTNPNELKAREIARASCTTDPQPYSMAGGPDQAMEQFSIACADGRMMRVRCDAGVCRELSH